MFRVTKKSIEWAGKQLTFETGKIARQAHSVLVTYGDTVVLATAVVSPTNDPTIDFFPLKVDYQEKFYASGKIPGGYIKREGKPSEREVLIGRLIDRPIRPLFKEGFFNETQVIVMVLSHDQENDSDIPAILAASAALGLSGAPFEGPLGAIKLGYINNEFVLNPSSKQLSESSLDLVVGATRDAVMMVEAEAHELSEATMLKAITLGHQAIIPVINCIESFVKEAREHLPAVEFSVVNLELYKQQIQANFHQSIVEALQAKEKAKRNTLLADLESKVKAYFADLNTTITSESEQYNMVYAKLALKEIEKQVMRKAIFDSNLRIDGRQSTQIRPIQSELNLLPKVHGSALFTRGETQALVVTTLGSSQDELMFDTLEGTMTQNFMLHYNFLPFSVGEIGRMGSPGRREIGHGKLAWRAIRPLLPKQDFPYTIRIVSEITESNGSSSMATVCGTSLSLMHAGVPIPRTVSGIAMGLIMDSNRYVILSDILGDEDHLGDMDFKVAGTVNGITALQMDIKIKGINEEILSKSLTQANAGRLHILNEMEKVIRQSNPLSELAPRIVSFEVPKDKIREIIGSGGKVIKDIIAQTQTKVDINDDGIVTIAATDLAALAKAKQMIDLIAFDPIIGDNYSGKVVKIMEFGAFVNFAGARDGLVHISEIANERVNKVEDILKEGDLVTVKLLAIDDKGRCKLSIKQASSVSELATEEPTLITKPKVKKERKE